MKYTDEKKRRPPVNRNYGAGAALMNHFGASKTNLIGTDDSDPELFMRSIFIPNRHRVQMLSTAAIIAFFQETLW